MPICLRDPTTGYGIFVENMLDAAAKCRDTPPGVSVFVVRQQRTLGDGCPYGYALFVANSTAMGDTKRAGSDPCPLTL